MRSALCINVHKLLGKDEPPGMDMLQAPRLQSGKLMEEPEENSAARSALCLSICANLPAEGASIKMLQRQFPTNR